MAEQIRRAAPSLTYLLITLPTAMVTSVLGMLVVVAAISIAVFGAGLVLLPWMLAVVNKWAAWHQRRAGDLLGIEVTPLAPSSRQVGPAAVTRLLRDPATRQVGFWLPFHFVVGTIFGLVAFSCAALVVMVALLPFWWAFPPGAPLQVAGFEARDWGAAGVLLAVCAAAAFVLARWAVPALARSHARGCVAMLSRSRVDALEERVETLTTTRVGVVDAHGAELRRIERDLHDSTQASLVTIAMKLGMARESDTIDPAVAKLLEEAHAGTEEAMTELRSVIRTIYPPILADRGLSGALAALGSRSGIPVSIDSEELGAVPVAVETAVYFVISEAIANAVKHSSADRVDVKLRRDGDVLRLDIRDDGVGGADEHRGTGITGIRSRVAALDGDMSIASPVGGPTTITVDLPCG